MAVSISTPVTCVRCQQEIPAGSRVRRVYRSQSRYFHQGQCPTPESRPANAPASATERQVRYALDLQSQYWTPAIGRRYTREELAGLSRSQVSTLIELLLENA